MADTWDTGEVERWFLNDEGLYLEAMEIVGNHTDPEAGLAELGKRVPHVNLDNVDWETVHNTMKS